MFLVDDHAIVREGFKHAFSQGLQLDLAEAETGFRR
jgi:hypothetical protein